MKHKDWRGYQEKTYDGRVSNLLKYFLENYTVDNAVDLGCGAGNESVYMVKNRVC